MLDIFGNVFGRNKKEKSGANNASSQSPSSSQRDAAAANEVDDFLMVNPPEGQTSGGVYPIILKDDVSRDNWLDSTFRRLIMSQ